MSLFISVAIGIVIASLFALSIVRMNKTDDNDQNEEK